MSQFFVNMYSIGHYYAVTNADLFSPDGFHWYPCPSYAKRYCCLRRRCSCCCVGRCSCRCTARGLQMHCRCTATATDSASAPHDTRTHTITTFTTAPSVTTIPTSSSTEGASSVFRLQNLVAGRAAVTTTTDDEKAGQDYI